MDSFWSVLDLEPTQDVSAIKRAYARKARECHPEEDPEGFLRLREAYQTALDYAQRDSAAATGQTERELDQPPEGAGALEETGEPEGAGGWILAEEPEDGPNPFEDGEAIRQFLELYTGKQRRDSKRWLDYFTSTPFLDAARDARFTQLMLEHITRLEGEYPVNREFLNWLCVAYQFVGKRIVYRNPDGSDRVEFEFRLYQGARFDGLEAVLEIAKKGPLPKPFLNNELAILTSFIEYWHLVGLAQAGEWDEAAVGMYSRIIGCYAASYITDKCRQSQDMDYERHPAGLRVLSHFFELYELPEELYRIAWQKLDLKSAMMGRAKILYGAVREQVLARLPDIGGEKRESFAKLKTETIPYFAGCYQRAGSDPQKDAEETDALFSREDFQRALLDRRFVEEEMLHTWVNEDRCGYYLQRVIDFYEAHDGAPCARQVIERARQMLAVQAKADREREDGDAPVPEGPPTLQNRPFFRHWLNTGFCTARDPETGLNLMDYLNQELPYLADWSRRFLGVEGDCIPEPVTVSLALGEDRVEVRFHLRYMDFLLNGALVCRPCLEWERVAALADVDGFFFLLPITVTTYDRYGEVKEVLLRRMADTAAPEECWAVAAACLAGQVCSLPLPGEQWSSDGDEPPEDDELPEDEDEHGDMTQEPLPPEAALPFELFAEDAEHLYGCAWFQRARVLLLFQQTQYGRYAAQDGEYEDVPDGEAAVALARQLLEEAVHPRGLALEELENLPEAVYVDPDFLAIARDPARKGAEMPRELLGEAVTPEILEELLWLYADGRMSRLELSWPCAIPAGEEQVCQPRRSLVFLKDGAKYACLYFDDYRAQSYALLARPELYGKEKTEFVPFRQSKLFSKVIHRGFTTIRRQLPTVFGQVSLPNNVKFQAAGIWDYAVNVTHGRSKYNMDKQLLGGFAEERARNNEDARIYFYAYPDAAVWTDGQGGTQTLAVDELARDRLQQMLVQFLDGVYPRLRLTWGAEPGGRRHIVLLHEEGRFLMAWLDEGKQEAEFHVADTRTYMDVEGKKYPKATFQGRIVGAYLVHDGPALRNALELLVANLDEPKRILHKFAEYAGEKPVKARPYEAIWADLVGDGE